jgi:adenylate cyclase
VNYLSRHRRAFLAVVCVLCTGIIAGAYWINFEPLVRMEFSARDFLARHGRKSPTRPELVFLAIDTATIALDEPFPEEIADSPALRAMDADGYPWSRDVYPMIIERLINAGARLIVFDMMFPRKKRDDPAFRAALERYHDKVVIGENFELIEERGGRNFKLSVPSPTLIPTEDNQDPRVGYVNFWPDRDGLVRSADYQTTGAEVRNERPRPDSIVRYSLAGRALSKLGHEDLISRKPRCLRFARDFAHLSLWRIFTDATWAAYPYNQGEIFRDKIVLIGPMGNWAHDVLGTPFGQIPGPELHLHALNAALNRDFVREPSRTENLAGILIAGFVAWGLSILIAQPFYRFIALVGGSVAYWFVAAAIFDAQSGAVILGLVPPLLAANTSGLVWLVCQQVIDRLEKARTRRTLERYVSRDLVKEILDNPASLLTAKGGNRRSVAILFSDLRGFTAATEDADSKQLVAQLNEYFTEMVKRIFDNKGTLDKFIGDAVMAVWGEIQSEGPAKDVERAVTAALQMQSALTELNRSWEQRGIRTFKMGIGVNYGAVIVGEIGAATGGTEKMELTVIGDPVNLASRVEGLTKQFGVEILLGEGAADLVTDVFHLQLVDRVKVKGKNQPIRMYTVLGAQRTPLPEAMAGYLACYSEGLKRYQEGHFAQAIESLQQCLKCVPDDPLASMYLSRCTDLRDNPPGPDWDGVFVATSK